MKNIIKAILIAATAATVYGAMAKADPACPTGNEEACTVDIPVQGPGSF